MLHAESAGAGMPPAQGAGSALAWFCLRSQVRHEHIAAAHLRQMELEVFNPRLRFRRLTRFGSAQVTEALFPGYLFAKFDLHTALARVHYAPGVREVVHFGARWPWVPEAVIEDIRRRLGPDQVHTLPADLTPGEAVRIAGGPLHGLEALITQVMPGRKRVQVLLDFLGRQATVELEPARLVKAGLRWSC